MRILFFKRCFMAAIIILALFLTLSGASKYSSTQVEAIRENLEKSYQNQAIINAKIKEIDDLVIQVRMRMNKKLMNN